MFCHLKHRTELTNETSTTYTQPIYTIQNRIRRKGHISSIKPWLFQSTFPNRILIALIHSHIIFRSNSASVRLYNLRRMALFISLAHQNKGIGSFLTQQTVARYKVLSLTGSLREALSWWSQSTPCPWAECQVLGTAWVVRQIRSRL